MFYIKISLLPLTAVTFAVWQCLVRKKSQVVKCPTWTKKRFQYYLLNNGIRGLWEVSFIYLYWDRHFTPERK